MGGPVSIGRTLSLLTLGAAAAGAVVPVAVGCAPLASVPEPVAPERKSATPSVVVARVTPSRLVPEVSVVSIAPPGGSGASERMLVAGLRILVHDDGTVERADARFAPGQVYSVELPSRLGGGFLFYQADSQGTKLWRADGWTEPVRPLAQLATNAQEVLVGFDRVYLRTEATNRLLALDLDDGHIIGLGQLPTAGAYGALSFVDGWRAVVDTELRGPLVSFDAGSSWHPLPLAAWPEGVGVEQGDPVVFVPGGRYRIDVRGHVQLLVDPPAAGDDAAAEPGPAPPDEGGNDGARHPLGATPLRTAVQSGWPDTATTLVVAHRGSLVRLGLPNARVLATAQSAYPESDADCQGVRVGPGFGFVCGRQRGATVVYRFVAPLSLQEHVRFAEPRFVSPSGNGWLAVRGSCAPLDRRAGELRSYCIVAPDGERREIGVRGDIGAERIVALADGRVAVLVPPRFGAAGHLTLISGDVLQGVELKLPQEPQQSVRLARRGLWLDGFEQRGKDRIGGWVEAGGPMLGLTIKLDGTVELGKLVEGSAGTLVSGPLALSVAEPEGAVESVDGGMTWQPLELPSLPEAAPDARTRGCSPAGCVLRGWVRVGWGRPAAAHDLETVAAPPPADTPVPVMRTVRLGCTIVPTPHPEPLPDGPGRVRGGVEAAGATFGSWVPFLGSAPPRLDKDQEGVAKGTGNYDPVPAHAYAWGPKGADWTRAGYWQLRFDDRFSFEQSVRSSAASRALWADRASAGEAIGAQGQGGYWRWVARPDPAGKAALLSACLGSSCRLYGVSDGRPILPLRDGSGRTNSLPVPLHRGTVQVGDAWYFITDANADAIELWRAELGVAERLARYPRLGRRGPAGGPIPGLVRRATGAELGLLLPVPPDPSSGSSASAWFVLPIDRATGELAEPIALGSADLNGRAPRACGATDDGWLVETELDTATVVDVAGSANDLDGFEYRLRLEPEAGCTEAIAARAGHAFASGRAAGPAPRGVGNARPSARGAQPHAMTADAIPLIARNPSTGWRWRLACEPRD